MPDVGGVVIHYFSARNVDPDNRFDMHTCRNLFLDLNRAKREREFYMLDARWPDDRMYASAHVLIGRDGTTWKLVDFDRQAYHAGTSILNGQEHCNRWTLGVELVGDNTSGFETAQYEALAELLVELEAEHGFSDHDIAGHDEVRHAAIEAGKTKKKKYDPSGRPDGQGDNFDWRYLLDRMAARESVPAPPTTSTSQDASRS